MDNAIAGRLRVHALFRRGQGFLDANIVVETRVETTRFPKERPIFQRANARSSGHDSLSAFVRFTKRSRMCPKVLIIDPDWLAHNSLTCSSLT